MKSVLFVDDERHILAALKRSLHGERHRWNMTFAEGAQAALELLATTPADVIVSDIRMPHMDGVGLLERVRELYPATVRLVLSGQSEEETHERAVAVAYELLDKPCETKKLCAAIERALSSAESPEQATKGGA